MGTPAVEYPKLGDRIGSAAPRHSLAMVEGTIAQPNFLEQDISEEMGLGLMSFVTCGPMPLKILVPADMTADELQQLRDAVGIRLGVFEVESVRPLTDEEWTEFGQ